MSVELQRRVASVLGITGWRCASGWPRHRCVTHISAGLCNPCGRAFLVLWSPGSPRCAQAKHLRVLAAGTCGFSGHCCLERGAVTAMFSGPIFWLEDDCQVYCFPPFSCPWSSDLWGFALLCRRAQACLPFGEHILLWWLHSAFSQAPPLQCCCCHTECAVGGELDDTCPAMSRWLSEGWHTSVPASGQHFPRDGLPAQNKLELWIYSACKTSAGINNWESKGLSVERTSGTCSCLPPSHHPFLWKWSQLHW